MFPSDPVRLVRVAAAVVLRPSRERSLPPHVLVGHRFPGAHLPDLWEFPGGKIEPGESGEQAALRELREETNVRASALWLMHRGRHDYSDRIVEIEFHACRYEGGVAEPIACQAVRWTRPDRLECYRFPEASAPVILALRAGLWLPSGGGFGPP